MSLQEHYRTKVAPALKEQFKYKNVMAVPRLVKVVLNVGVPAGVKDQKALQAISETLRWITGQHPVVRPAKKSISNFKIRKGQTVGYKVTLRGKRMYEFLERFIQFTLPRVRDFRGLSPKMVDVHGNFSLGFREVVAFPEVKTGELEHQHGLEVTVVTTAKGQKAGLALLKLLGFPFQESKS